MSFMKSLFLNLSMVLLIVFALSIISSDAASDIFSLVYKGCANRTTSDVGAFRSSLSALLNSLLSQSSTAQFSKASSGSSQNAISGLFQCRGDLSNADCSNCVRKNTQMSASICGASIAGRTQLRGCYIHFEEANSLNVSGSELQYKICSKSEASFDEKKELAFEQLETGIAGGSGFYATMYASVYLIGQCEGDLSTADCVNCVKEAARQAKTQCGSSTAAQIYLNRCYISYNYYPNGVPGHSSGSRPTVKTAAMIVGVAFALFFLVICLLFIRSVFKKKGDY